jgi:hypothetical protein
LYIDEGTGVGGGFVKGDAINLGGGSVGIGSDIAFGASKGGSFGIGLGGNDTRSIGGTLGARFGGGLGISIGFEICKTEIKCSDPKSLCNDD